MKMNAKRDARKNTRESVDTTSTDKKVEDTKLYIKLIIASICGIVITLFLNLHELDFIQNSMHNIYGKIALYVIGFLIGFVIYFIADIFVCRKETKELELKDEEIKNKKKEFKPYLIISIIAFIAMIWYYYYNYDTISQWTPFYQFIGVGIFFACIYGLLEFFYDYKLSATMIVDFGMNVMIKVFAPFMFGCIIFLGTFEGKYGIKTNLRDIFLPTSPTMQELSKIVTDSFSKAFLQLYDVGAQRPVLMFYLCILAFFFAILWQAKAVFLPRKKIKDVEDYNAQEILDLVIKEAKDKADYKSGKKVHGKVYLFFDKLNEKLKTKNDIRKEKLEEEKEKEEERKDNVQSVLYDIELKRIKKNGK